jgi:hypothetical protein
LVRPTDFRYDYWRHLLTAGGPPSKCSISSTPFPARFGSLTSENHRDGIVRVDGVSDQSGDHSVSIFVDGEVRDSRGVCLVRAIR